MRTQIVGLILLTSSVPSLAEERGFYVGLGAGLAEVAFDRGLEGDDTALQAFAGFSLNKYVAGELSYIDAGEVDSRFGAPVQVDGFAATVVGSLPLGERWSLFARVGALSWQWQSAGIKHEGTDVIYGLGAAVAFGRIQVRLEGGATHLDNEEMRVALLQGLWRF